MLPGMLPAFDALVTQLPGSTIGRSQPRLRPRQLGVGTSLFQNTIICDRMLLDP